MLYFESSSVIHNHQPQLSTNISCQQKYKCHLMSQGKKIQLEQLEESIHLLDFTSQIMKLFRWKDVISHCFDARISKAKYFLEYLKEWKAKSSSTKHFLSAQLWFDLRAMIT
jgi:hypothetical protein